MLEDQLFMKDGLNFVLTTCGEQFVMEIPDIHTEITGVKLMVWLFVDNLDIKN